MNRLESVANLIWENIQQSIGKKTDRSIYSTYLNGRTPECVSMWIFRLLRFWKSFWQRGQLTTVELRLCTSFEWRCSAARDPRSFEHNLH